MTPDEQSPTVRDNPAERRFELFADGQLAGWADYRPAGASIIIAHTEVEPRFEGRGLGSHLIRATLDQIRADGKTVIPLCAFTAAFIHRHPEYVDLVDESMRSRFA